MSHQKVHLQISPSQLRKLKKGQGFQASSKQLTEGLDDGKNVELELEPHVAKKLHSAVMRGKGFRFNQNHYSGGSLRDIGNYLKNKGKQALKFVGDNLGTIANYSKKLINKDTLKGAVDTATSGLSSVIPELAPLALGANTLAKKGIDRLYEKDYSYLNKGSGMKPSFQNQVMPLNKNKMPVTTFGGKAHSNSEMDEMLGSGFKMKSSKRSAKASIANVLPSGTPDAIITDSNGKTTGRGKFAKGSQEAKDYMANLRSMRKKKVSGGSFLELGGKKNGGSFMELGAR
jgi:hypothetical protein